MGTFIKGTGTASSKCCGCGSRPSPCDGVPGTAIQCRTAEASITKCGFSEWAGYVSTPPKLYLKKTLGGAITAENGGDDCAICNTKIEYVYSGYDEFTKVSCPTLSSDTTQLVTYSYNFDCINITTINVNSTSQTIGTGSATFPDTYTSTVHTITGVGCLGNGIGNPSFNYYGSATETLSDEWTTADLESEVTAAIPAFSGPFLGGVNCSGAYYDKTTDELTITKRKMEYKFPLPTLVGYTCYGLSWDEVFTPKGGGSPTITPKNYSWNGSDTETPIYTIDVPASEGVITVTEPVPTCSC